MLTKLFQFNLGTHRPNVYFCLVTISFKQYCRYFKITIDGSLKLKSYLKYRCTWLCLRNHTFEYFSTYYVYVTSKKSVYIKFEMWLRARERDDLSMLYFFT